LLIDAVEQFLLKLVRRSDVNYIKPRSDLVRLEQSPYLDGGLAVATAVGNKD
jgi:hypothetical protein